MIISSALFSLIAGGALYWHYQELEQVKVDISGRYARYRLCDPQDMPNFQPGALEYNQDNDSLIYLIPEDKVGELAISLDSDTKWVYPRFRKRYLQPESGEMQVLSSRYMWEIIKPGYFVTRSQRPQYFLLDGEK